MYVPTYWEFVGPTGCNVPHDGYNDTGNDRLIEIHHVSRVLQTVRLQNAVDMTKAMDLACS
jgi:hypothetical protein